MLHVFLSPKDLVGEVVKDHLALDNVVPLRTSFVQHELDELDKEVVRALLSNGKANQDVQSFAAV